MKQPKSTNPNTVMLLADMPRQIDLIKKNREDAALEIYHAHLRWLREQRKQST